VEIELEITEKDKGKEIEVKAKAKCRNATPAAAINWISRLLFIISLARHDEQMLERGWEVRKT